MRMRLTIVVILMLVAQLGLSCGSEPQYHFDSIPKQQFARLPGKIGVTLENYNGKAHIRIEGGELAKVSTLPIAPPEAQREGIQSLQGPPFLTAPQGHYYRGPCLISPDKNFIVTSVSTEPYPPILPTTFTILEYKSGKQLAQRRTLGNFVVFGVAWSPDSKYVASLQVLAHGPKWWQLHELILAGVGHPASHIEFRLEIVDLQGNVIGETNLASDYVNASGQVIWNE
jgi:hypothetical protein